MTADVWVMVAPVRDGVVLWDAAELVDAGVRDRQVVPVVGEAS